VCFGYNGYGQLGVVSTSSYVGKLASDMGTNLQAVQLSTGAKEALV
jgi:hypothetical protein